MASTLSPWTSLRCWRSIFRELRPHCRQTRCLVTIQRGAAQPADLPPDLPKQFWSQLPSRLRPDKGKREITIHDPPPSRAQTCKDPVLEVSNSQIAMLDPTGARKRLFDYENWEGAKPGDILLATFKSGEPFSGVILSIKQRGVDSSVLLRNQLTRVGTEMQIKIYSPLLQSMEIVQKAAKRKRRARLYYLRQPKHDVGSVQKIVTQYLKQRELLTGGKSKGTGSGSRSRKSKRK